MYSFKIREDFPEIELWMEPCPAFSGININYDQHGCLLCPYIAGKKAIEKHMCDKQHRNDHKKTSSGLASQVMNVGVCKAQFWVVELLDNEPLTDNNDPSTPRSSSPIPALIQSQCTPSPT
jgi:hypothetical protein